MSHVPTRLIVAFLAPLGLLSSPSFAQASEPDDLAVDPLDTPEGAIPIDPAVLPGDEAGEHLVGKPRPKALGDKILFVNFDGGQMNPCGDSPQNNCSSIFTGTVLPYAGDAGKRASVIQIVRKRVADFGITVTDTRPTSGDYDMEMVGNWEGANPAFAGVAPGPIDCGDTRGGQTSFTLEASQTSDGVAEIILQEVAHTWGLEHVNEVQDLLFPTTQGQNKTYRDECIKIVSNTELTESAGVCNSIHTRPEVGCQSGFQNSYKELLFVFGPSTPDTAAPLVQVLSLPLIS